MPDLKGSKVYFLDLYKTKELSRRIFMAVPATDGSGFFLGIFDTLSPSYIGIESLDANGIFLIDRSFDIN